MSLPTIQQTPFARVLLPMIVGILLFETVHNSWVAAGIFAIATLLLIIYYLTFRSRHAFRLRSLFGISVGLWFVCIGFFLTQLQTKKSEFDFSKTKKSYVAEVISVPQEKERSYYCQLKIEHNKKILGYFHKDRFSEGIKQGDQIYITGELQKLINTNRPGGFDFAKYMHRQGFSASIYIDSAFWKKKHAEREFNLVYLASDLREKVLSIFRSFGFEENEFALLSGITIGYQDALTMEQKSNFSAVGLSHLMAVSGMQTAMIYTMLWFLLGFIPKNSRFYRLKYVAVILGLWIFTFVTGLSASVVRASIMLTVLMMGGLFNRQAITLNSLCFAAFCLLLYNPFSLYDIGFQLSFMAVLSILIAQDLLTNWLNGMRKAPRYFAELSTMTIAAQLGTSPLSIFYFHQFPLLFLVVNLIVLPFNSALVYLACLSTFLASINIPHLWFDKVLQYMLASLDYLTEHFAQFPFAQLKNLNPNAFEIALFYLLISLTVYFFYQKRFRTILFSLAVVLSIVVVMIFNKVESRNQKQILIYSQFGKSCVEYISNGKSTIKNPESRATIFGGKRILTVDYDVRQWNSKQPMPCDILLITKGFKGDRESLIKLYKPHLIVLDASLSKYYAQKLRASLDEAQTDYYDISLQGAFIQKPDKQSVYHLREVEL